MHHLCGAYHRVPAEHGQLLASHSTRCSGKGRGRPVRQRSVLAGAVTAALGAQLLAGIASPIAAASVVADRASRSPEVVAARPVLPAGIRDVRPVPASQPVSGELALAPRDPARLASYASAVSTPGSSEYHHYLPAGAFGAVFGPTSASVLGVEAALRAAGLKVNAVSGNGLLVSFKGPAALVGAAFHTRFDAFRLASGRVAFANTSALELPASVASSVQGVIGLNTLATPHSALARRTGSAGMADPGGTKAETAAESSAGPVACSSATADANNHAGLTDSEIAEAYGLEGLYSAGDTGQHQTIAIYELEPYSTKDISAFDTCYFGAATATAMLTRLHTVVVDGGDPTGTGSGESELDIEDVSAVAPGATIEVYEAPLTTAGYLDDFNRIIQDDTAKIVTSSWSSGCETTIASEEPGLEQVENTIFEQAAAQGQTVLAAAGDAGSDACAFGADTPVAPFLSVTDPSSQPYVLSVGGTTIDDATQPPSEQVWNDGASGGSGGGGISALWPSPAWQARSKVPGVDDRSVIAEAQLISGDDFCQSRKGITAGTSVPGGARRQRGRRLIQRCGHCRNRRRVVHPRRHVISDAALGGDARRYRLDAELCRARRRGLRVAPALRNRLGAGRVQRVVQRHHRVQQRHVGSQRRPLPGDKGIRHGLWARVSQSDRPERREGARVLPVR